MLSDPVLSHVAVDLGAFVATSVDTSVSVVGFIIPHRDAMIPQIYRDTNSDLGAALHWLVSTPIDDDGRAAILAATTNASAKMAAFNQMLGIRRANRLVRSQAWLDMVQDRLFDPAVIARVQNDPYWWLNLGKFLAGVQKDDTDYIQQLGKTVQDAALSDARNVAKANDVKADTSAIEKIPPYTRERLRKIMQILESAEKQDKSS